MKKIVALLICALLALIPSLAEELPENPFGIFPYESPGDPGPRGEVDPSESIDLEYRGESIRLNFDPTPQYSSIQNGMVQASYYAYSADGSTLYELFISFPETARPGMIITPQYEAITNGEASVSLIVSNGSQEQYYLSSLANGYVYPTDSDFSISIDSISGGTYVGSFSATLIALDLSSGAVADTLVIPDTPFRFTLGSAGNGPDGSATPEPTIEPNDMRKV